MTDTLVREVTDNSIGGHIFGLQILGTTLAVPTYGQCSILFLQMKR